MPKISSQSNNALAAMPHKPAIMGTKVCSVSLTAEAYDWVMAKGIHPMNMIKR